MQEEAPCLVGRAGVDWHGPSKHILWFCKFLSEGNPTLFLCFIITPSQVYVLHTLASSGVREFGKRPSSSSCGAVLKTEC